MSLFASLQIACLIAFTLLLLGAAWQDWRTMHIADAISLGIIATFVVWAIAGFVLGTFSLADLALALVCAAGMFGLGTLAFAIGAMGGGDVKLAAALALWFSPVSTIRFLVLMSLAGGILTLVLVAWHRAKRREGRPEIPYGVAIAVGAFAVLGPILAQRFLNHFA